MTVLDDIDSLDEDSGDEAAPSNQPAQSPQLQPPPGSLKETPSLLPPQLPTSPENASVPEAPAGKLIRAVLTQPSSKTKQPAGFYGLQH